MGKMENISVPAVNIFFGMGHRNIVFCGICKSIFPASDLPFPPGGNDLQFRIERHGAELKPNLVVSFTGTTMRKGIGSFGFGNFDHVFGDQRSRKGGA